MRCILQVLEIERGLTNSALVEVIRSMQEYERTKLQMVRSNIFSNAVCSIFIRRNWYRLSNPGISGGFIYSVFSLVSFRAMLFLAPPDHLNHIQLKLLKSRGKDNEILHCQRSVPGKHCPLQTYVGKSRAQISRDFHVRASHSLAMAVSSNHSPTTSSCIAFMKAERSPWRRSWARIDFFIFSSVEHV